MYTITYCILYCIELKTGKKVKQCEQIAMAAQWKQTVLANITGICIVYIFVF